MLLFVYYCVLCEGVWEMFYMYISITRLYLSNPCYYLCIIVYYVRDYGRCFICTLVLPDYICLTLVIICVLLGIM